MTARPHYDPEAGPWVAYESHGRKIPGRNLPAWHPGGYTRSYLWSLDNGLGGVTLTTNPADALRFDSHYEAMEAAKRFARRPGADRVSAAKRHRATWLAKVDAARPV